MSRDSIFPAFAVDAPLPAKTAPPARVQTRAQVLSVQPGRLSMRTRRRLDRIRALLTEIAVDWDAADSGVCLDCDMLRDQVDAFEKSTMAEGLQLLREPYE